MVKHYCKLPPSPKGRSSFVPYAPSQLPDNIDNDISEGLDGIFAKFAYCCAAKNDNNSLSLIATEIT